MNVKELKALGEEGKNDYLMGHRDMGKGVYITQRQALALAACMEYCVYDDTDGFKDVIIEAELWDNLMKEFGVEYR
jgi:hypothetical protein